MAKTRFDLSAEVEQLLLDHFTSAKVEVRLNPGAERISGHIITPDFIGGEHLGRHNMVHDLLRKALKKKSEGVSIILAYTPDEYAAMSA